ncbi:MAG: nucleotidyltransferase substrate binding protein [Muribaculaceae bacterium]|nr:nucleotidyltransferase substrate binding protein [Muribaculaceae bacterium]
MATPAKRFLQRLESYERAFNRLDELVTHFSGEESQTLFSLEESGLQRDIAREALIKRFEFTQELSWNLLKDFLQYQGVNDLTGSRDVYRRALSLGLTDTPEWLDMIQDRNLSAHDYNDTKAKQIVERIIHIYHPLFRKLRATMKGKAADIPSTER